MEPPVTSSSSSYDERPGSVKKGKSCKRSRKAKSGATSSSSVVGGGSSVSAKRGKGTKEDLDQLLKAITAQAAHVRTVKTQQGAGEAWRKQAVMLEIQKLLELKYKYCALSPTPVTDPQLFVEAEPAHVIKVRWEVRRPDGTTVRLQVPFRDVVHVTGQTIIDAIQAHTAKACEFPNVNGFIKIEIAEPVTIVSAAGTGAEGAAASSSSSSSSSSSGPSAEPKSTPYKKSALWRAVMPEDTFYLPLRFPGPVLEKLWVFNFRVTFPERTTHLITPAAYHGLEKLPELVDTGVNLFSHPLCDDATRVVSKAFGAGVSQLVLIATNATNSAWSVQECAKRERSVYTMVGVHPYKAVSSPLTDLVKLKALAASKYCIAIGECGLDVPKAEKIVQDSKDRVEKEKAAAEEKERAEKEKEEKEDKEGESSTSTSTSTTSTSTAPTAKPVVNVFDVEEVMRTQEKWLEAQIELAIEVNKPLFFHERGCPKRFIELVSKYADRIRGRAVINCFTGTAEDLKAYLDLGFYIAITGFLCNDARGVELREVVKHIPLDKLLIGSDAPHLIPFTMPKPYPRENEPAYLPHVLVTLAECLGLSLHEVARATTANARAVFGLPVLPFDGSLRTPLPELLRSPNVMMAIANITAPVKKRKEEVVEVPQEPEPVSEEKFKFDGKIYYCSTKEKTILEKQQKLIDEAAFKELIADFGLEFREEPKPKPPAKKEKKPRRPRPNRRAAPAGGAARGGRGGKRGGRGRGGRGRGRA